MIDYEKKTNCFYTVFSFSQYSIDCWHKCFCTVYLIFAGARYQGPECRKLAISGNSGDARGVLPVVRVRSSARRSLHTNAKFLGLRTVRISTRVVRYLSEKKIRPSTLDINFQRPLWAWWIDENTSARHYTRDF